METGHRVGYKTSFIKFKDGFHLVRNGQDGGQLVTWVKYRALIGSAPS